MNMKKYILLLGFAMASVDCSASGVAYGNAVVAVLQAIKSLMGLKDTVQEALNRAKGDLGVGGGTSNGDEKVATESSFARKIGITEKHAVTLNAKLMSVQSEIPTSSFNRQAFLRKIDNERPNLAAIVQNYQVRVGELLIAMQGLHRVTLSQKDLPHYGFVVANMQSLLAALELLNTEYKDVLDSFEVKNNLIIELGDKLENERTAFNRSFKNLRKELTGLITDFRDVIEQQADNHRREIAREQALQQQAGDAASGRIAILENQVQNKKYMTWGKGILLVGISLLAGGLINEFKIPMGQAVGNKLNQLGTIVGAVASGTKSIFAKMPGIGRIFAPALVAVAGSSS